jgi:phage anti-repressor protein
MMKKERPQKRKGFLVVRKPDAKKERDFELDYLLSLSLGQRISMMERKSRELRSLLAENGHREASAIIKRK